MTDLTICPREDCTATTRHWHTPLGEPDLWERIMTTPYYQDEHVTLFLGQRGQR